MFLKRIYDLFFNVPSEERSSLQIILWWEIRRIPFNILIGILGLISLILVYVFVDKSVTGHPGEDIVEPLSVFAAPFAINFCYTFGWITELSLGRIWKSREPKLASKLLRFGIIFSVFVISLPPLISGIIFTLIKMGFLDKLK